MSEVERPEDLAPEVRQRLADWLLALSDNKQLLGLRYAEWCTGAPELEADIAASAMAQYELGHARLLHGVLTGLPEDPRGPERDHDPASWRSLPTLDRPFADWTELVAANTLLDTLLTHNMQSASKGRYLPLSQRLRKAVAEERYHFVHGSAWFRRIATGPEGIAETLGRAVERAWPECIAWFGPSDPAGSLDALAAAGVLDAGAAELRDGYVAQVAGLFEGTPLTAPARRESGSWIVDVSIDWDGWSEASRRHGTPQFGRTCFEMITGAGTRALGVRG